MTKLAIQAVAFDKDGVIFDSERLYREALELAITETGVSVHHNFAESLRGMTSADSADLVMQELKGQIDAQVFIACWLDKREQLLNMHGLAFIPGVESLIETLYEQVFLLAMVTSDSMDNVLHDVNYVRPDLLQYFSVVVTLDDVVYPKPNPEPYQRAAALLGVASENLLVIEDSVYGAQAALSSGAKVLLLADEKRNIDPTIAQAVHAIINKHQDVLGFIS